MGIPEHCWGFSADLLTRKVLITHDSESLGWCTCADCQSQTRSSLTDPVCHTEQTYANLAKKNKEQTHNKKRKGKVDSHSFKLPILVLPWLSAKIAWPKRIWVFIKPVKCTIVYTWKVLSFINSVAINLLKSRWSHPQHWIRDLVHASNDFTKSKLDRPLTDHEVKTAETSKNVWGWFRDILTQSSKDLTSAVPEKKPALKVLPQQTAWELTAGATLIIHIHWFQMQKTNKKKTGSVKSFLAHEIYNNS